MGRAVSQIIESLDRSSESDVYDILQDVEIARHETTQEGDSHDVDRATLQGETQSIDTGKEGMGDDDKDLKRNRNETTKDDSIVDGKTNENDEDASPEPTNLHRMQAGAAHVTPGAVPVRPFGRSSIHSSTEGSEVTDHVDDAHRKSILELEAELVNPESASIQEAEVKPAHVAHAEPMDEELLRRIRNESNVDVQRRKKKRLITIGLCVIILVVLAISIGVGIYFGNNGDEQKDGVQNGQGQGEPKGGVPEWSDFLHVTQHALLVNVKTDCTDLKSKEPPYIDMRIQCGNTDPEDGQERMKLENKDDNVSCSAPKGNSLECNVTFSPKPPFSPNPVRTFYGIIFTCGNSNTNYPFNSATVTMFPLTGSGCRTFAEQTLIMARFCGRKGEYSSPKTWRPVPAISPGSCNHSKRIPAENNWTFCESRADCSGVSPCEVGEIIGYDSISNKACENPGGPIQKYSPPDIHRFRDQMNLTFFPLLENI